ncbi:F0F1 ATP synthase subunit I [Amaricoccus sp. HAR-UPW-R2A-40]|nr:F0F1 ATP synthase subunit I [Amaricoccus sp. HAR-UPW-R2A-40]
MSEDPFSERLKRLEDRIEKARRVHEPAPSRAGQKFTQSSIAWRMVTELVAGMILGLGLGWGLDSLFGTRPVFLVIFALLGFAAGIRTMMRTAAEVKEGRSEGALMRPGPRQDPGVKPDEERGTDGD